MEDWLVTKIFPFIDRTYGEFSDSVTEVEVNPLKEGRSLSHAQYGPKYFSYGHRVLIRVTCAIEGRPTQHGGQLCPARPYGR
jgi:hypothetical protein